MHKTEQTNLLGTTVLSAMRAAGRFVTAAALAFTVTLAPGKALARLAEMTPFGNVAPVGERELAELRGGFLGSSGAIVRFGFDFAGVVNGTSFAAPTLTLEFSPTTGLQMFDNTGTPIAGTGIVNTVANLSDGLTRQSVVTNSMVGVLNVVQNSVDLARIQTVNTITVQFLQNTLNAGVANFRRANMGNIMGTQGLLGLR